MALKGISLLVMLFICTCSSCKAKVSISREEDLELERQLKILNKPPLKTIQTKEGDIIDCIDIYKQPALDHPLLKNHKIQLKPTSLPVGMPKTSSRAKSLKLRSRREACPAGTVPIQRTRKEDLIRARSLKEPSITFRQHASGPSVQRAMYLGMKPGPIPYYGASGYVSIWNLSIAPDQASSANIWITNGPQDEINLIASGLMVSQALNGDNLTRLFSYWTGDGYHETGCFNTLCPGFVQIDKVVTPNYPAGRASTYGGDIYALQFLIQQDFSSGNWWLVVDDNPQVKIGYWPKAIFKNLGDGAQRVAWGGVAWTGADGISPPMGNGRFARDGLYNLACHWRQVNHIPKDGALIYPKDDETEEYVDKSGCYNLINGKYQDRFFRYVLIFGGPGGNCDH